MRNGVEMILERGNFVPNGFGNKVSFIAHCTQCYVTRQLSEYEQREINMTRNFIALNPVLAVCIF